MKHPREMSNSELAFALNEAPEFGLEEIKIQREVTKRLLKLEEFERSNAPRDGNILRKDNTTDMEYDATIIQLRSIIMSAERNFECITKMKDISESRRQAKFALRKLRERMGEDRVVIEYGGKRYVRKVDSDRVFDIAEINGDMFLRLQDANGVKKQTILLKEIEDKKPESCSTTGDGRLTIDEAISHASEVADRKGCTPCGNQHKQLADWLTELKALRKRMDFLEKVRLIPKDYQGCLVKWTVEGGWHDKDGQVEGELGQINTEHYGCVSNIKDGLMRIEHCSHIAVLHNLWVDMIQCDEAEKDK